MEQALAKARVLVEALPWLRTFAGRTFVIEYGGHAMADEACRVAFAQDVVLLSVRAANEAIVTGGMIPRIRCAVDALSAGVRSVHVVDGRLPHVLPLEIFTDRGVGTVLRA